MHYTYYKMKLNPRTAKLFQLTFAAKGGVLQPPPPGFWSSRPNFFLKFFTGIVSGSRNPKVIVRTFYLYHVTLKHMVIDLERDRVKIIIIIIIWFGDTVTVSHPTKCNTNSKVRALS